MAPDELLEFVLEVLKLGQARTVVIVAKDHEEIDVAVGTEILAEDRSEHIQSLDAELTMEIGDPVDWKRDLGVEFALIELPPLGP